MSLDKDRRLAQVHVFLLSRHSLTRDLPAVALASHAEFRKVIASEDTARECPQGRAGPDSSPDLDEVLGIHSSSDTM